MSDYQRITEAISYIASHVERQPTLEEIASNANLSPYHFQRLFSRWAGVTPKRFLQILTVDRAKALLAEFSSILDASTQLGLSSSSRLYDHFVQLEAVTPGEYKSRGIDLTIEYSVHETPFGHAFIAITDRGICKLSFLGESSKQKEIQQLEKQWPNAILVENNRHSTAVMNSIFTPDKKPDRPLSLLVSGTNFQVSVWKALMNIPPAKIASYSQIAKTIGRPDASRAVGRAIGLNPVALLIPCHRVIQHSGRLGGYHWGETRKHAIHAWEAARYG